jgi:hypothetical protein
MKAWDPKLQACAQFECRWLASQKRENPQERMPIEMRPNRCGVVIGPVDQDDGMHIFVQVEPTRPNAWKRPDIASYLDQRRERGFRFTIIIGERHIELEALTTEAAE